MARTEYRVIDDAPRFINNLCRECRSFVVESTQYTRKVKIGKGNTVIFNETGLNDQNVLNLIQMAREDAKSYITKHPVLLSGEPNYFDLSDCPPKTLCTKIDITSAYWQCATMRGVISESTDKYLRASYTSAKQMKGARLKALGSLATRKTITNYIAGNIEDVRQKLQPTKELYMDICLEVDLLMQEIVNSIDGAFFYYVDCVFTDKKAAPDIIEYLKKSGYSVKCEDTEVKVIKEGDQKYIECKSTDKKYIVPYSKHNLLAMYQKMGMLEVETKIR